MTSSEICPSHVTLTLTLSVQGHTVSYDFTSAFMFVLGGFFSNYVAALQSGHTVFSGFLLLLSNMKQVCCVFIIKPILSQ